MNQANVISLLRTLLIFAGTFFIGHSVLNQPITSDVWDMVIGVSTTAAGAIWAVATKTATPDIIESSARVLFTGIGGFLVAAGILSNEKLQAILGLIAPLIAFIQSMASKSKVVSLTVGKSMAVTNKNGQLTGNVKKVA